MRGRRPLASQRWARAQSRKYSLMQSGKINIPHQDYGARKKGETNDEKSEADSVCDEEGVLV